MATIAQVKREREEPIVATLKLTENELRRVFDAAVHDEVAAQRASDHLMTDVGDAAMYTLGEKVRAVYRGQPDQPSKGGDGS